MPPNPIPQPPPPSGPLPGPGKPDTHGGGQIKPAIRDPLENDPGAVNVAAMAVDSELKSKGKFLGLPLDDEEVRLIALRLGRKVDASNVDRLRQVFTAAIESHPRARRASR